MTVWIFVAVGLAVLAWRRCRGLVTRNEIVALGISIAAVSAVQLLLFLDAGRFIWDRRYQEPNVIPLLAFSGVAFAGLARRHRVWKRLLLACFVLLFARMAYRAKVMYAPGRLNAFVLESSKWAASVITEDWKSAGYERIYCPSEYMSFNLPVVATPSPLVARLLNGRWLGVCFLEGRGSGFAIEPMREWRENPDYICIDDPGRDFSSDYERIAAKRMSRGRVAVFRRKVGVPRFPDDAQAFPRWKWHY